jgi:predicted lipid-binding transport protein (Tim44 family)
MKKYLIALMIAVGGLSLAVTDADARRLGGGGSFGKQTFSRQAPTQQATPSQATSPTQARSANQQQTGTAPASPMRSLLGGALLGLGLGALLAHFGIGGALASIIATVLTIGLLVLAASFLYRLLRGKTPSPAYSGHYGGAGLRAPEIGARLEPRLPPAAFQAEAAAGDAAVMSRPAPTLAGTIPADFDVPAFVGNAKTYFIRLQAAWDRADINDIREFTTPEMFAELRMQLQERGASANHTDVVSLEAEVLGVETVGSDYVVGVRFSGLISEEEGAQPEPFTEIWNLSKPVAGGDGWLLAGIQQVS